MLNSLIRGRDKKVRSGGELFVCGYICPDILYLPIKEVELMDFKMNDLSEKLDIHKRPKIKILISNPTSFKAKEVEALIDTGAPYCFLTKEVIDFLELEKISDKNSVSYMSKDLIGEYEACVNLDGLQKIKFNFRVFDKKTDTTDCLIGTDLLQFFEFIYNNPKGDFTLKYIG